MRTREANFAKRRPVGSQLVGDDNRWNETLVTKEFAEQPLPPASFRMSMGFANHGPGYRISDRTFLRL